MVRKKQSKNSPKKIKKESGSKNNLPYNFNKILKSIKELKSNNKFSQVKFDEIKEKLFKTYYNLYLLPHSNKLYNCYIE